MPRQLIGPGERRLDEAVAVDLGDAVVEVVDERGELCVGETLVEGVEQRAVAEERVRLAVVREPQGRGVELTAQHVVGVVAARVRAAERIRVARRGRRPAAAADEPRREPGRGGAHNPSSTPVRALNSSISVSHSPASPCFAVQKAGSRRASKSSSETPCCSTHVK